MKEQGRLLIVSATEKEVAEIRTWAFSQHLPAVFCITGPGIAATVFELTKTLLNTDFSLVVNSGIAGSFTDNLKIGEVVQVTEECFGDSGAEDGEKFIHISELGFDRMNEVFSNYYFPVSIKPVPETGLRKVKAITVNKVHGYEHSIQKVRAKFKPDIETMEGAAVAYTCRELNIPCLQLRCISNRVEERDKSKWQIDDAVASLRQEMIKLLSSLTAFL